MIFSRNAEQDLASGPMLEEFEFPQACSLLTVYVKSDVPIIEDVSIEFVSAKGSQFDTLIEKRTLLNEKDYVYAAVGTMAINEDDKVRVGVTNANATGSVAITVKART